MIYSGLLTETLHFYEVVETQSASGYKSTEEVFKLKVRAQRTKNKERYSVDADEIFHTSELTFKLRYRREIKETDIVVYGDDKYRITSLDKFTEANQLTIIIAKINE